MTASTDDEAKEAAQTYAVLLETGKSKDGFYVAMRRLLLYRQALAGKLQRQAWQSDGVSYVAFREFLRQQKQGTLPPRRMPPAGTAIKRASSTKTAAPAAARASPSVGAASAAPADASDFAIRRQMSSPSPSTARADAAGLPAASKGARLGNKPRDNLIRRPIPEEAPVASPQPLPKKAQQQPEPPKQQGQAKMPSKPLQKQQQQQQQGNLEVPPEQGEQPQRSKQPQTVQQPLPRPLQQPEAADRSSASGAAAPAGRPEERSEDFHQTASTPFLFSGILEKFNHSKASVTCVKFARKSSDVFAFASANGMLRVCCAEKPVRIIHDLAGHTKEISDFDWSLNNDYLCSCSLDRSVRVWNLASGECLRIVYTEIVQLCIRFHAVNNNFLLLGNAKEEMSVMNFSTGRVVHRLPLEGRVTALDVEPSGRVFFAGDSLGCIHSIKADLSTGVLTHAHRNHLSSGQRTPATVVQFCAFSAVANGPVLLTGNLDGTMRFFSVALEVDGYLSLKCSLKLQPRARNIRAAFCPFLRTGKRELIVTGGDDHAVHFFDLTRPRQPAAGKLQGHSAPVVDVCWNAAETLLVSSDCDGGVICWARNGPGSAPAPGPTSVAKPL